MLINTPICQQKQVLKLDSPGQSWTVPNPNTTKPLNSTDFISTRATIQVLINSPLNDWNADQNSQCLQDCIHSSPTCTELWCLLYYTYFLSPSPSTQKTLISHCITKSQFYQILTCLNVVPNSFLRAICHYIFSNTSSIHPVHTHLLYKSQIPHVLSHPCLSMYICLS